MIGTGPYVEFKPSFIDTLHSNQRLSNPLAIDLGGDPWKVGEICLPCQC